MRTGTRVRRPAADVIGFWVVPAELSEAEAPLSQSSGPFDAVVAAYNQASGDSFDAETTPSLLVGLRLRNGTAIGLSFSREFPPDHVLISMTAPEMEEPEWYQAKAPGLLEAIWELVGDYLEQYRQHLDPQGDWLPE